MLKRALTYFVLTLIVLQSVGATADAHQQHQSGVEHLTFDESHQHHDQHNSSDLDTLSVEDSSQNLDCHHCCHCHGHFCPAILMSESNDSFYKRSITIESYTNKIFPQIVDSFLRPPIA